MDDRLRATRWNDEREHHVDPRSSRNGNVPDCWLERLSLQHAFGMSDEDVHFHVSPLRSISKRRLKWDEARRRGKTRERSDGSWTSERMRASDFKSDNFDQDTCSGSYSARGNTGPGGAQRAGREAPWAYPRPSESELLSHRKNLKLWGGNGKMKWPDTDKHLRIRR